MSHFFLVAPLRAFAHQKSSISVVRLIDVERPLMNFIRNCYLLISPCVDPLRPPRQSGMSNNVGSCQDFFAKHESHIRKSFE